MARTNAPEIDGRQAPSVPPDAPAERSETAAAALAAIDDLSEKQQEVVCLKFRHGLSYREIAEVTGLSASHVGVLIHEGMKALRRRLNPAASVRPAGPGGA